MRTASNYLLIVFLRPRVAIFWLTRQFASTAPSTAYTFIPPLERTEYVQWLPAAPSTADEDTPADGATDP